MLMPFEGELFSNERIKNFAYFKRWKTERHCKPSWQNRIILLSSSRWNHTQDQLWNTFFRSIFRIMDLLGMIWHSRWQGLRMILQMKMVCYGSYGHTTKKRRKQVVFICLRMPVMPTVIFWNIPKDWRVSAMTLSMQKFFVSMKPSQQSQNIRFNSR